MSKRICLSVLTVFMALILLVGCSSQTNKKTDEFDAAVFVDECKVLTPAGVYKNSSTSEFATVFTENVFKEFKKSVYFKNMTEEERVQACYDIGEVLKTLSYGNVTDGFIDELTVDSATHSVKWHNVGAQYDMQIFLVEE